MRISKHFTSKLKSLMRKVKLIQKYWRNSLFAKHSRQHLLAEMLAKLDKHKQLQ